MEFFYLAEDAQSGKLYMLRTFETQQQHGAGDVQHCTICLYDSDEEFDQETEDNICRETIEPTYRYCQLYSSSNNNTNTNNNNNDSEPVCKHVFHTVCLYDWFKSSRKIQCPLCKQGMEELVPQLPTLYRGPPVTHRRVTFFGNLVIYETMDEKKHGPYLEYHGSTTNSQKKIECAYQDGLLHGDYRCWYVNGRLKERSRWVHGHQVGPVRWYNSHGKRTFAANFDQQGQYHGSYRLWDTQFGRLMEKGRYRHGTKVGVWKKYFVSSQRLRSWVSYDDNGLRDGKSLTWFFNGNLHEMEIYRHGVKSGLHRSWHPNGQIRHWSYWSPETLALEGLEVEWFESGQVHRIHFNDHGQMVGPMLVWDSFGRIHKKCQYIQDQKHGKQLCYRWDTASSRTVTIERYRRGELHGRFTRIHPDGTKTKGQFDHNKPVGVWSREERDGKQLSKTDFGTDGGDGPVDCRFSEQVNRILLPFASIL
jgi:antitoxin component YwqK of YwqJK toxin-antitoxin module